MTLFFDYGGTIDTGARHWAHVLREGYQQVPSLADLAEEDFREAYVYAERYLAKYPVIESTDDFLTLLQKKVRHETNFLRANDLWNATDEEQQAAVEQISAYCDDYARRYAQRALPVLEALRAQGHRLLVASNFYGNLHTVLARYGLLECFEQVVESAVVGARKPDPCFYELALKQAKAEADCSFMIGDSYTKDIIPAKAVGIHTVWMRGEPWKESEIPASPRAADYVIECIEDVLELEI